MARRLRQEATLAELERIYHAQLPDFRRVAAAIVGDRELACDVVQEAFADAVHRRASYRREGTLEAWVWRIVVNAARDERRRCVPEPSDEPEPSINGGSTELDASVRAALALLPERQRLVLFLRYYADLDYATIAAALEISPGTVGATLNAAHAALRPILEEVRR